MTAQIAVLNRVAIALAPDSAVTMQVRGEDKVFTSANKLFTLSDVQPVGIMIYGSAEILGIPWETMIKLFRKGLGNESFATLREYGESFVHFLNGNSLFSAAMQDEYLASSVYSILSLVEEEIEDRFHEAIDEKGEVTTNQAKRIVSSVIGMYHSRWMKAPRVPTLPEDFGRQILSKNRDKMEAAIRKVFEDIPLSVADRDRIRQIVENVLVKQIPDPITHETTSGIVIAGFGEEEVFPDLVSFETDGVLDNNLRYWEGLEHRAKIGSTAGTPAHRSYLSRRMTWSQHSWRASIPRIGQSRNPLYLRYSPNTGKTQRRLREPVAATRPKI